MKHLKSIQPNEKRETHVKFLKPSQKRETHLTAVIGNGKGT